MSESKQIGGGLLPLPVDERDIYFGSIFSLPKLEELPDEFIVGEPLKIKDQGLSDHCTGYALTAVSEDQEGIELSPLFQFAKGKQLAGDPEAWGLTLRFILESARKFGSVPQKYVDKYLPTDLDSNELRDGNNWPKEFDTVAKKYKKKSYMFINGPYDHFDNIRATIWRMRAEKRSVITGIGWSSQWTNVPKGIILPDKATEDFGHAFKIFGWTVINGVLHLVAQLSNGTEIGDGGLFYFPREVINRGLRFGSATLQDMPASYARYHQDYGIKAEQPWYTQFYYVIKKIIFG